MTTASLEETTAAANETEKVVAEGETNNSTEASATEVDNSATSAPAITAAVATTLSLTLVPTVAPIPVAVTSGSAISGSSTIGLGGKGAGAAAAPASAQAESVPTAPQSAPLLKPQTFCCDKPKRDFGLLDNLQDSSSLSGLGSQSVSLGNSTLKQTCKILRHGIQPYPGKCVAVSRIQEQCDGMLMSKNSTCGADMVCCAML